MSKLFRYRARDRTGRVTRGAVQGESFDEAARRLTREGLYPTKIVEAGPAPEDVSPRAWTSFAGVPDEERIALTSRLAALIKGGVPVLSALTALIEQGGPPALILALEHIRSRVEGGGRLSEAMAERRDIFNEVYTELVAAGEVTGSVDRALDHLTATLEREHELKNRIRDITRYPKIVLAGMALAMIVLMGFVMPRYVAIFEKANLALPLPTRALMAAHDLFRAHALDGAVLVIALAGAFLLARNTARGRTFLDRLAVTAPAVGEVALNLTLARWANVLASMVRAGIPIIHALTVSARATGNAYLAASLGGVAGDVAEGSGLAEPLRRRGVVPPVVVQMVAAGEASGALDDTLEKVSGFLEDDAKRKTKSLAAMAEAGVIVALGLLVLFLALSVFLPMWDITRLAHRG